MEKDKKINICFHIGNISNCGGTEKVTTQISSLLLNNYKNYNVFILSNYYDKDKGPFFKENNNIVYDSLFDRNVNNKLNFFNLIFKLKKFIKKNDIDILIGVDTILSLFDIPAIKGTKCKYIAWEHFNFKYNLGVKLRDIGRKYACKKADAVVVLTDKDKKYFLDNLTVKNKIVRIYNPFLVKENDYRYDKDSNVIMSSGRLTYQKGFDILIDVANELKSKTSDFKWLILGDGEDRKMLEEKIEQYKLQDNVELVGRVNNVDEYYKKSRMFVLTSRFEGLVLVALEAKAYSLPIVSFDFDCGPSETIKNNKNGFIVECFDIKKMAKKIYELLSDKDKCMKFSNNSKLDMDKFEPNLIVNEWDTLIKELLK